MVSIGLISLSVLSWGCNQPGEAQAEITGQTEIAESEEAAQNGENESASPEITEEPSEEAADLPGLADCKIQKAEGGGISFVSTVEEFGQLGFEFGDSVNITFSNGSELKDVPYYNGTYTKTNAPFLSGKPNEQYITAKTAFGEDLWTLYGVSDSDTATVTLKEHGKYTGVILCAGLQYSNQREDFESDDVFANFRNVSTGKIKKDILYRGASPCDNSFERASCVDSLMSQAGVSFVLDLSDDDEMVKEYLAQPDFKSEYFRDLYNQGKVKAVRLTADYGSETFAQKLVQGLVSLSESEGPCLIHCMEGKERTGFACALLECLCGADYDEIKNDFMLTYANYYGISETSDKEKYDSIVRSYLDTMLLTIVGEDVNVREADLEAGAIRYLTSGGMTSGQIEALKNRISGQ